MRQPTATLGRRGESAWTTPITVAKCFGAVRSRAAVFGVHIFVVWVFFWFATSGTY